MAAVIILLAVGVAAWYVVRTIRHELNGNCACGNGNGECGKAKRR